MWKLNISLKTKISEEYPPRPSISHCVKTWAKRWPKFGPTSRRRTRLTLPGTQVQILVEICMAVLWTTIVRPHSMRSFYLGRAPVPCYTLIRTGKQTFPARLVQSDRKPVENLIMVISSCLCGFSWYNLS